MRVTEAWFTKCAFTMIAKTIKLTGQC